MIKRDIRYIFKRIIIGIGIVLGISFIRSCKVYALENQIYPLESVDINQVCTSSNCTVNHSVGDKYDYKINGYSYVIEYKSNGLYVNDTNVYSSSDYLKAPWFLVNWLNSDDVAFYVTYSHSNINQKFKINKTSGYLPLNYPITSNRICKGSSYSRHRYNFHEGVYQNMNSSAVGYNSSYNYCMLIGFDFNVVGSSSYFEVTVNNANYQNANYTTNFNYSFEPSIVSLNSSLNKTDEGMLVSVSFSPQFTFVDTDNYNYYAWFEGEKKMLLTANNVTLNTQRNTTFYVEITDKQGNLIDSESYVVSSIGLIYNGTYDIQFTSQEFTQSDFENDSDAIFDTITRIDIDTTYIPKWVNYKYEYQFVNSGSSLNDNSWVLVNDNNDKNNFVYTTNVNGTLYARILDNDNNVLKSSTFQVTRIGQIKNYDTNKDDIFFSFNKLKEVTNFGGPIAGLIVIPVNVLQAISDASNKVCTPYNLGSLLGTNITLPCIDVEHYLGSALWTTIDLIFSGCLFFAISKWFTSAYYNFIMLENTPGIKERRDL